MALNELPHFGISAWSWHNCQGQGVFVYASPTAQSGDTIERLQSLERLKCHEQELAIEGYSGRYEAELEPLPDELGMHESRCARLFQASLRPLLPTIQSAIERYGASRVALILGSSTGGIDATEAALKAERETGSLPKEYQFLNMHTYDAQLALGRKLTGISGPGYVVSTACSSSGKALGAAARLIASGRVDAVITGGVDALCELTIRGFAGLGVMSPRRTRPFDKVREGISIGEGAALLLLERDTDSEFQLLGVGESSDAHHATAPHPEGLGAKLAIERCLSQSGLDGSSVGYLNAHGTGTQKNDSMESLAIAATLGQDIRFSSTKHLTGHQLGAAGGNEVIYCLKALEEQYLPANGEALELDADLALQPDRTGGPSQGLSTCLSNSFAFGGSNVTVAVARQKRVGKAPPARSVKSTYFIRKAAFFSPDYADLNTYWSNSPSDEAQPKAPAKLLAARTRGRASVLTRLFAELLFQLRNVDGTASPELSEIPTVYGSAFGEMQTTLKLLAQLGVDAKLSPIRFQSSVHNTASGQLSLATKNRAFSTAIAAGDQTVAMSLTEAQAYLDAHGGEIAVLVADEEAPTQVLPGADFQPIGFALLLAAEAQPNDWASIGPVEQDGELTTTDCASPEQLSVSPPSYGEQLLKEIQDAQSLGSAAKKVSLGPGYAIKLSAKTPL